jgi:hypothetical protein
MQGNENYPPEILLKVALNTITLTHYNIIFTIAEN